MIIFSLRNLAFVLTMFASLPVVRADIGDTPAGLRHRYGSAKDMGGQMLFEVKLKDGQLLPARDSANPQSHYTINVYFDGEIAGMEVITRNTTDPVKSVLTPDDIQQLLDATSDGMTWVPFSAKDGKPTWIRKDAHRDGQRLLARFEDAKGNKADDAQVLIIMLYTEK